MKNAQWLFLAIVTLFGSLAFSDTPTTTTVHTDIAVIKASSIKSMFQQIKRKNLLAKHQKNGKDQYLIYVYEGDEVDFETVGRMLPKSKDFNGMSHSVIIEHKEIKHSKDICIDTNTEDIVTALSNGLNSLDLIIDFDQHNGVCYIREQFVQDDPEWPLNKPLGPEAGNPMNCKEAAKLLREAYHWKVGEYYNDVQKKMVTKTMNCCESEEGLERAWDGNYEGKTVRNLLSAVLRVRDENKKINFREKGKRSNYCTSYRVNNLNEKWTLPSY